MMNIRLHENATTTPASRATIQALGGPVRILAQELEVLDDTIRRWCKRERTANGSHAAHNLNTTMTTAREAVVVTLRRTLWLPLEDLLVVTQAFINKEVSCSAVHQFLQRKGIRRLPARGCELSTADGR